jgi:hypothetical protein
MSWMILLALVAGLGILVLVVLAFSKGGPRVTTIETRRDDPEDQAP